MPRPRYLERLQAFSKTESMIVVTGQRRSGKSYILRQYIDRLISSGVPRQDILYLNLFLDDLSRFRSPEAFRQALGQYEREVASSPQARLYIVIDEVAEMTEWQSVVATLLEHPKRTYKIIISGSNARLLSSDLPHTLRGRYYDLRVYTLDYSEFCAALALDANARSSFLRYMQMGGMPEVVAADDAHARANLLTNIKHSTVKNDIIDRYHADPAIVERLIEYTRQAYATTLSTRRIGAHFRSMDRSIAESTIKQYMTWMEDVYWVKKAPIFSARTSDLLKHGEHKYYLSDHGFAFGAGENQGRLLENLLFNELERAGFTVSTFQGYHLGKTFEIDFMAARGPRVLFVQSALSVGDPFEHRDLHTREFGNFAKLGRRVGEKVVVSLDEKREEVPGVLHVNPIEFIGLLT
jgi:predicted AAA+ superfamily ATPase